MRKYMFIAIIFILILVFSQVTYAQSMSPNLAGNYNYLEGFSALRLDANKLFLPSDNDLIEEEKSFSLEGQEKLFDLASQFDRVENSEGFSFGADLLNEEMDLREEQIEHINTIINYNKQIQKIKYLID